MLNCLELLQWLHKEGIIDFTVLDGSITYFDETKVYVIQDCETYKFVYAIINGDGDVIAISDSRKQGEKDNG